MDNNYIQIERYLQQEMSADERREFENRLATDKDFLKEFTVQKQITEAVINTGIKNEFGDAIHKRILTRQLIRWGIVLVVVAAAFLIYAVKTNLFSVHRTEGAVTEKVLSEKFLINNAADTIIETNDGLVFAIPANAFNSTAKNIELEIKTAMDVYTIIQNGLSTESDGSMLQTAGMFYFNGLANDQPVSLVKDIAVSVPAREINPAMQLFDGVPGSSGQINWVNPKPVEKKLRTYDITKLDFYPPDYIPTLKALQKNYTDKRYTDSLYYSFSGYPHSQKSIVAAKDTAAKKVKEQIETVYRAESLQGILTDTAKTDQLGTNNDRDYSIYEIDPARIKTIWNKQFNNTILATKEFEERLRYIHQLCDPVYLDAYLELLDKPMYEIDKKIAERSNGAIKAKFLEFAARKDGAVIIAGGMQEKLSTYFQQKYTAYKEAAAKTWAKYEAELQRLNTIADDKMQQQGFSDFMRENKNFDDEFCINLTDAYKQIGVKRTCNDTIVPPNRPYYNFNISTTGWKNLDVYVFEATNDRQSMSYTDPVTGKTAKLTYSDISIQIENQPQFDKVLVYLIPDSLSSFQRVQQQGELFKEKLNMLFRYDAVVLAYKGADAYYYRQALVQPTSYTFRVESISDDALRASVKQYSIGRKKALQNEFEFQLFEQQETLRQIQLQKDLQFREQVAVAIFKCLEWQRQAQKPGTAPENKSKPK